MDARSKYFEKKLERTGVKVPRGSVLLKKGFNAPIETAQAAISRTVSAGPNNLRTYSEITGMQQNSLSMVSIGEENEEEEETKHQQETMQ